MILIMGAPEEPMMAQTYELLKGRGREVVLISPQQLPGTIRFGFGISGAAGFFSFPDGGRLPLDKIRAIYQRLGFLNFSTPEGSTEQEARFVNMECLAAVTTFLNSTLALVVNPPLASGSNASKPYQISLIEEHGFRVPRTLVTNFPESAREFYVRNEGKVVYKSISYLRSIVQSMKDEDLERLPALRYCPVQLQEEIQGTDVRVHVVGDRAIFATIIHSEASDYRYDRSAEILQHELPRGVELQCFSVARALGLRLAGIDLRVTPEGEYYCFEVNPSPAFSWYESRTGQPITAALCDLLENP